MASDGSEANGRSEWPSISNDASRIAFASEATNLEAGDTNPVRDVYIHDRDTDDDGIFDEPGAVSTTLLSTVGTIGAGPSDRPQISATASASCTRGSSAGPHTTCTRPPSSP